MDKRINTIIEETKKDFADLINSKLQEGLPISVIGLIIDAIQMEVKGSVQFAIQNEARQKEQLDQQNDKKEK